MIRLYKYPLTRCDLLKSVLKLITGILIWCLSQWSKTAQHQQQSKETFTIWLNVWRIRITRTWIFVMKTDQKYVCLYTSKNGLSNSVHIICTDSVMYFLYAINEFAQSTYITNFIDYEGYGGGVFQKYNTSSEVNAKFFKIGGKYSINNWSSQWKPWLIFNAPPPSNINSRNVIVVVAFNMSKEESKYKILGES